MFVILVVTILFDSRPAGNSANNVALEFVIQTYGQHVVLPKYTATPGSFSAEPYIHIGPMPNQDILLPCVFASTLMDLLSRTCRYAAQVLEQPD